MKRKFIQWLIFFTILVSSADAQIYFHKDFEPNNNYTTTHVGKVVQTNDTGFALSWNEVNSSNQFINLVKMDGQGSIQWSNKYSFTDSICIKGMEQTIDNGYILVGTLLTTSATQIYLLKTDATGNVQWSKTYDAQGNISQSANVHQTGDGGYIIGATTFINDGDFYIIKTDAIGQVQWSQIYDNGNGEHLRDITPTSDGGYAAIGYTKGGAVEHSFLLKIDANGVIQWSIAYEDLIEAYALAQTTDNGFIVCGTSLLGDACELHLWKTDAFGQVQWVKYYDHFPAHGVSVSQTTDGGFLAAASSEGSYGILKVDAIGDLQWGKYHSLGGTSIDPLGSHMGGNGLQTLDGGYAFTGVNIGGYQRATMYKLDALGDSCAINDGYIPQVTVTTDEFPLTFNTQSQIAENTVTTPQVPFSTNDQQSCGNCGTDDFLGITAYFGTVAVEDTMLLCDTLPYATLQGMNGNSYTWTYNGTSLGTANSVPITATGTYTATAIDFCGLSITDQVFIYLDDDCVWMGDVNRDDVVDMQDLTDWGLSFSGATGPIRPDWLAYLEFMSNDVFDGGFWSAFSGIDWGVLQSTNSHDLKHTDCDGDGVQTLDDPLWINTHFNNTHNGNYAKMSSSSLELSLQPVNINDYSGDGLNDTIFFDVHLEDTITTTTDIHGIYFEVDYTQWSAQNGAVIGAETWFDNSWIGAENTSLVGLYRNYTESNKMYVGMTRFDQIDQTGSGKICRIGCMMDVDVLGIYITSAVSGGSSKTATNAQTDLTVSLQNAFLLRSDGTKIPVSGTDITLSIEVETENATTPAVTAQLYAVLESAYQPTNLMSTHLSDNVWLPISQPYNVAPWYYTGNENVINANNFPANTVDWVLVEVRSATNPEQIITRKAALLLNNGQIVTANNPNSGVQLYGLLEGESYYIALRHRNHLPVMSAKTVTVNNQSLTYNFTAAASSVQGTNQLKEVANGIFALHCGDFDANGVVNIADFNTYQDNSYLNTPYHAVDLDLNGVLTIQDFNFYRPNASKMAIRILRY